MQSVCIKKKHYRQESNVSCVAASARMVLSFFGIEFAEEYLRKILKTKPYGTNVANLLHLNDENLGVSVTLCFLSMSQLMGFIGEKKAPCIVVLDTGWLDYWEVSCLHMVVVVGFDEEHILVNDPYFEDKEIKVPKKEFINAWSANDYIAIIVLRE